MCDGAFLTREYTYDAMILKDYFLEKLADLKNVTIFYQTNIQAIERDAESYKIITDEDKIYQTGFVLNATYAGINQILDMARI